jgi:hypothetical protein
MQTIRGRRVLGSTRLLRAFAEAPGLDRPTKLCYLLMAAYGRDSGECYASSTTLARDLRASRRQVKRYWEALRRQGFIRPNWVPGKPTHHVFLWHPVYAKIALLGSDTHDTPPMTPVSSGGDMGVTQMYRTYVEDASQHVSSSVEGQQGRPAGSRIRPQPKPTTTELHQALRAEIWAYMQGERKTPVSPPDNNIVNRCFKALHGHSLDELRAFLKDRFRKGYQPGRASGPKDYTWFPTVIENAFKPRT